jgi:hypothetical protein
MNRTVAVSALLMAIAASTQARAADPFYLGAWKLESAVVAPWADPKSPPDANEQKKLLGKVVSIKAKEIGGPQPFACKGPHYKLVDYTPDLLFQGAFAEMQSKDKSADPMKLAASVGLAGAATKTLETGCEFDWHFASQTEAKLGLNDYVYTLKKQ